MREGYDTREPGSYTRFTGYFCLSGGFKGMKECVFECKYLDDAGECEPLNSECIGDMCENWKECATCTRAEECKE